MDATTHSASDLMEDFPKPEGERPDWEAKGAEYLRTAKIEAAKARWDANCPLMLKTTDWQRPVLADSARQIGEILAWTYQGSGLLISGPTGRGKSRSCWALLQRLASEGREIKYFTGATFFSDLQAQVRYGRDEAGDWVKAIARVPLVFIDDLGQEAVTAAKQDWAQGWFFQFLDQRLGHGLPLIITTNLSSEQIAGGGTSQVRADPLIRRLLEMCKVVKF